MRAPLARSRMTMRRLCSGSQESAICFQQVSLPKRRRRTIRSPKESLSGARPAETISGQRRAEGRAPKMMISLRRRPGRARAMIILAVLIDASSRSAPRRLTPPPCVFRHVKLKLRRRHRWFRARTPRRRHAARACQPLYRPNRCAFSPRHDVRPALRHADGTGDEDARLS